MKFESIHVNRYGCLEDLATPDPLPSIVVVLGPNESGKSTFFSFLTDLLYGFRPATRENHPYAPWSGGDPEGRASIRLDDGTTLEIRRRLTSSGRGSLSMDGRTEEIRNRPLAFVEHVNRSIFRHVYALTLAELASLEGQSWNIVQDRLVAALGMEGLRPARDVAAAFEAEANRLWRPDNRGRPRVRVLRGELAQLYERRHDALELDRALRAKVAAKAEAEDALAALGKERRRERADREVLEHRLTRLLPVRRELIRIEGLRAAAGPRAVLENLPRDPVEHLETLRNRRREAGMRVEEFVRDAAVCRDAVERYEGSRHEAVAAAEERIRHILDCVETMPDLQRNAAVAEQDVATIAARCDEQGAALFEVPWQGVSREALAAVSVQTLLKRVGDREKARARLQAERDAEREGERGHTLMRLPGAMRPGPGRLVGGLASLAAGLGLAVWPAFYPDATVPLAGVAVGPGVALSAAIVIGVAGLILLILRQDAVRRYRQYRRAVDGAEKQRADRIAELTELENTAARAAADVVAGLPIHPSLAASPGMDLPPAIGRMIDLSDRLRERETVLRERREKVASAQAEIRGVRMWVSARVGGEAAADADALREVLDDALKAREAASVARQQLARIEAERIRAENERDAAAWELDTFETVLKGFAEGDADRGARAAAGCLEACRRADGLRQDLEREYRDLDEIENGIVAADAEGATWEDLRERLDEAASGLDRLTGRAEEMQAAIGRLDTEIRHLREGETVNVVEGRIKVVQSRVREAKQGRDRAFVLARLVREAERRFRDANRPELLLRAGRYLKQVTRGRYERIEVGEVGTESFYLHEPSGDRLIRVGETTSRGTKEQVYMALRLAMVNHLDSGKQHLPVFMDETLVNWDAWRRDQALDLLEQLAEERQVFIFTCHPAMAAEMEDRGGKIIPLVLA